jgi:type IV fimbrial biogenesis protein FimT
MGRVRVSNPRAPRRSTGLTLIELMVAVAVAAIILGLAAPSFSEYIVTQRLRSIHAQMATDLQFARSEAVARSAYVSVRFQADSGLTCYVIFTRPDPAITPPLPDTCDCTAAPGARCSSYPTSTTELRTVTIPQELKVRILPPSPLPTPQPDTVSFDPRSAGLRFPAADTASLVANGFQMESSAEGNRSLRMIVLPSGRPRLCTPVGSTLGGSPC